MPNDTEEKMSPAEILESQRKASAARVLDAREQIAAACGCELDDVQVVEGYGIGRGVRTMRARFRVRYELKGAPRVGAGKASGAGVEGVVADAIRIRDLIVGDAPAVIAAAEILGCSEAKVDVIRKTDGGFILGGPMHAEGASTASKRYAEGETHEAALAALKADRDRRAAMHAKGPKGERLTIDTDAIDPGPDEPKPRKGPSLRERLEALEGGRGGR